MGSQTRTIPVTMTICTVLEHYDLLQISRDHPNSPNVRCHNRREPEVGEDPVTPTLSKTGSSLGILPDVDLAAFTGTDQYIEDNIFEMVIPRSSIDRN